MTTTATQINQALAQLELDDKTAPNDFNHHIRTRLDQATALVVERDRLAKETAKAATKP